jgi:hypothetical protein
LLSLSLGSRPPSSSSTTSSENKRFVGRPQDLADAAQLESFRKNQV